MRPAALPLATVPIADQQIVRASLTVSLAAEVSTLGGDAIILTPATPNAERLFPTSGNGASGVRVQTTDAEDLPSLHGAAAELAEARGAERSGGGIVFVRVPPLWLHEAEHSAELLRWLLLFTSPDQRDLADTYTLATRVLQANPTTEIGVTVHGAREQREAENAFGLLARSVERRLGLALANYGLLVEDLDIYRAIVACETVGQAHPGSPAAHALRETASLVFERAHKTGLN